MAVGDVVNGIGLLSTTFEFRPAVGVSVLITSSYIDSDNNPRLTNGTDVSYPRGNDTDTKNIKVFINNDIWLYILGSIGNYGSYTGMVVQ
jgi:hypothetical protein